MSTGTPESFAAAQIAFADASEWAIGFSINAGIPRSTQAIVTCSCNAFGVATTTPSGRSVSSILR
jgi:hypothetical protein